MLKFCGGGVLSALATKIITSFIKVDENYLRLAKGYPVLIESLSPEPQEMIGFALFWILYAVSFLFLFFILEKIHIKNRDGLIYTLGTFLTLSGAYVLLFAEEDQFYINMSWFMAWKLGLIIVFFCLSIFFISTKINMAFFADFLALALTGIASAFCYVRNPLFGVNSFHFNGYFSTIYNIYNGATLGVDSKIIYGTYAYLFYPIYKIFGLSLSHYAATTMIMCLICMLCEWYVIRNLIKNPVIRILTHSGCVYINVFFAINAHEQFITQHFPMRVFFPMIMLAYIEVLAKKEKMLSRIYFFIGWVICYLAFMMNLESAVTTCLTWMSACFYYMMIRNNFAITDVKRVFVFAIKLIVGLVIAFIMWVFTIEVIAYIKTGTFILISELYSTQIVFAKIGYGMLPLPDYVHIYMFVFLVYALFLGIAIKQVFWGIGVGGNNKWQMTFALSVTGILMLTYYMGRTHNRSLFTWLPPCFILLAYLLEGTVWCIKRTTSYKRLSAIIISGVLFIVVSVFGTSTIYLLEDSWPFQEFFSRQIENNYDEHINNEIDLLHKYEENGTVNYLGNYAASISLAAGVHNNFLGEMAIDWFSWDDYKYIERFIKDCDGSIIIDDAAAEQINTFMPEKFDQIMDEKRYVIIDSSNMSVVYGLASNGL